jgi:integrase
VPKRSRLTTIAVDKKTKPGRYADGDGLYLQVSKTGTKAWLLRYMRNGRAHQMGLGAVGLVSLADARQRASDARRQLLDGLDPIEARSAQRMELARQAAAGVTFRQCAERYIAAHEPAWRNGKHRAQWRSTLTTYCYPVFGEIAVGAIDVGLVLKAIEPIWTTKPETAVRVRGRVEAILDWATARGYRHGDNPARWKGHLDKLLPARGKVRHVKHHAALPYGELAAFMAMLREREGVSARALEFVILTAARTSEAIGARWSEIDLTNRVWTIPLDRMKGGREHRVPLSAAAIRLIEGLPRHGEFVFPGARSGKPLSNMALLTTLRRMGRGDLTAHGFRSSFRDWAAETTGFPSDVVEMALAHVISSKVEAAYRRGDLFSKRRRLMDAWASHCALSTQVGVVVPLRGVGA